MLQYKENTNKIYNDLCFKYEIYIIVGWNIIFLTPLNRVWFNDWGHIHFYQENHWSSKRNCQNTGVNSVSCEGNMPHPQERASFLTCGRCPLQAQLPCDQEEFRCTCLVPSPDQGYSGLAWAFPCSWNPLNQGRSSADTVLQSLPKSRRTQFRKGSESSFPSTLLRPRAPWSRKGVEVFPHGWNGGIQILLLFQLGQGVGSMGRGSICRLECLFMAWIRSLVQGGSCADMDTVIFLSEISDEF